jgi:hypothetical protein
MLRDRIQDLFRECDPDVKEVLSRIIEAEWAKLRYDKPKGIIDEIQQIIDAEVRRLGDEA